MIFSRLGVPFCYFQLMMGLSLCNLIVNLEASIIVLKFYQTSMVNQKPF